MTSERPHLSISQLEMHARCEKQWEFRYAMGIKNPPGVAAIIGKGTHGAVEKDLGQKLAWGELLGADEVKDAAADATKHAWENERPVIRDGDPDQGGAVDLAVALASLHHTKLAPRIEPVALEQAFIIEIPELPYDVMGVVDIETATDIRDVKTRGKTPAKDAAQRSPQLIGYHLRSAIAGRPSKTVALDVLVKARTPKVETRTAAPTRDDHLVFLRRVELAARSIQSGIFKPTNPDNWWCTQKWCGYWHRCEFGARQSVTVGLIDPARLTSRLIPRPHTDTQEDAGVEA